MTEAIAGLSLVVIVLVVGWARERRRADELQAALSREIRRGAQKSIQGEGYRAHLRIVQ
jgi:hypothetical protein